MQSTPERSCSAPWRRVQAGSRQAQAKARLGRQDEGGRVRGQKAAEAMCCDASSSVMDDLYYSVIEWVSVRCTDTVAGYVRWLS